METFSIMGIDPSLRNTGICILTGSKPNLKAEYELIAPKNIEKAERLNYIYTNLVKVISEHLPISFAAIEGYDYKGFNTIPLAEVNAVIQLALYQAGIAFIHAAPAQVKKFAVGNSQASKDSIIIRYKNPNEHLADAHALAELAYVYETGDSILRNELEVIDSLKHPKPKPRFKKIKTDSIKL